jgi:predicted alpha/beta superfamily hydrolase
MKNFCIITLLVCIQSFLHAQLTIRVTSIPINTPPDTKIHAVGRFNSWKQTDSTTLFKQQADGSYTLTLLNSQKTLWFDYKINRGKLGSWEGDENGGSLPDRTFAYEGKPMTVNIQIAGWEKETPISSTADENVRVIAHDFFMPQLNRKRRIWVYLPPNYETDTTKHFPVMYMQNGQNLFNITDGGSDEWKIDETLNALSLKGDKGCIVIGVEAQVKDSLQAEYTPWRTPTNWHTEGVAYADFIVNTLKPYIDAHFRTKKDRLNTAIGGSMMGGLEAIFIASEHQNVFSKAAIFSPSLSYSDSCFLQLRQRGKQRFMRYYIVSGTDEDATRTADIEKMIATFREIGYNFEEAKVVKKIDGEPTEWFWAREFPNAYKWLFKEMTAEAEEGMFDNTVKLSTNLDFSVLNVESSENLLYSNIRIFDTRRKLLFTGPLDPKNSVDISFLQSGNYIIHGVKGEEVLYVKNFIKK